MKAWKKSESDVKANVGDRKSYIGAPAVAAATYQADANKQKERASQICNLSTKIENTDDDNLQDLENDLWEYMHDTEATKETDMNKFELKYRLEQLIKSDTTCKTPLMKTFVETTDAIPKLLKDIDLDGNSIISRSEFDKFVRNKLRPVAVEAVAGAGAGAGDETQYKLIF